MRKINLLAVLNTGPYEKSEIAKMLFPENAHPSRALTRVLKDDGVLDSRQISCLAMLLDVSVDELYSEDLTLGPLPKNTLRLSTDEYMAFLISNESRISVKAFSKNSLKHGSFSIEKDMPISNFLTILNTFLDEN